MGIDAAAVSDDLADVALADFVAQHYDRLLHLAYLVCRDPADAADAVQVGLEQAWRRRSSLRQGPSLKAWLDRIVVREAIRVGRHRRLWFGRTVAGTQVTWVDPIRRDRLEDPARADLRAAFGRLSAEQRAVIALHLHAGYTVAETADLVGAPVETVRSRLRLAKERLAGGAGGGRVMTTSHDDGRLDLMMRRFMAEEIASDHRCSNQPRDDRADRRVR